MSAYGLTEREQQLTRLVLQGYSTIEIADHLVISVHTVQGHLRSVFTKTGVCARRDLVTKIFFSHYEPRLRDNEQRTAASKPLRRADWCHQAVGRSMGRSIPGRTGTAPGSPRRRRGARPTGRQCRATLHRVRSARRTGSTLMTAAGQAAHRRGPRSFHITECGEDQQFASVICSARWPKTSSDGSSPTWMSSRITTRRPGRLSMASDRLCVRDRVCEPYEPRNALRLSRRPPSVPGYQARWACTRCATLPPQS